MISYVCATSEKRLFGEEDTRHDRRGVGIIWTLGFQWRVHYLYENHFGCTLNYNKDIQIPSKHNRFIILFYFRATCFDCLTSSSGPITNRPKTI